MKESVKRAMPFAMLFLAARLAFAAGPAAASNALPDTEIERVVTEEIGKALDAAEAGASVAVRIDGRTLYFNFGWADRAGRRPVTSDSLFNLGSLSKLFDVTLLSLAVQRGDIALDDPVAKYVRELQRGRDIRAVTLDQLMTFTSGFSVVADNPPWWPAVHYDLPKFLRHLRNWRIDKDFARGRQYLYSHAGFLLLHVALERRYGMPYADLLQQQLLQRLALPSTILPLRGRNDVGIFTPSLKARLVQGYSPEGKPLGKPGNVQGYYHWPGTSQMFSSARDLAAFLALHLGEGPQDTQLREAVALTHREVAEIGPGVTQARAFEVHRPGVLIVDKNGGLNNTTTYFGMIPKERLGVVILINRGDLNGRDIGHAILLRLAPPESSAL
jgi:beta-lactamase class C